MFSAGLALGLSMFPQPDGLAKEQVIPLINGVGARLASNNKGMLRDDQLENLIVKGAWRSPSVGEKYGVKWEKIDFDANGRYEERLASNGVIVLTYESEKVQPAVLETPGVSLVYANGSLRSGDVYGTGAFGVPVTLKKGRNEFVCVMGRGFLQAKLVLNRPLVGLDTRDLTVPDVVEGQEGLSKNLGVIVRNGGDQAKDLSVTIRPQGRGKAITTQVPLVLGESLRKVAVEFDPKAEPLAFTLELRRGKALLDSQSIKLSRVKETQNNRRTFISQVDGSVQYFSVNPSSKPAKGLPLFLSLHGAGVEANGQAAAYGQKDWAYLAAATNRRPYGFNWEDIGRLDAFEVLALAEKQLGTDPMRRYLTGHSMGGHGTWHLAAHYPDRWAGASPAAGWISYWTYGGIGPAFDLSDPVQKSLRQATNASDTFLFKNNLMRIPIYTLHGDADDTVNIDQPRKMREFLAGHSNFKWHEEKGQGHWYDADPEPGASCLDYKPASEWFKGLRRRTDDEVKDVDFTTVSTRINATQNWLEVIGQEDSFAPSRVALKLEDAVLSGTTDNVKVLAVHPTKSWPGRLTIRLDGSVIEAGTRPVLVFWKSASGWKLGRNPSSSERDALATLGFKDVFNRRFLAVVGISGTSRETDWAWNKVRFDNELYLYRGNGSFDIVTDQQLVKNPAIAKGRNVLLYGHSEMNLAWSLYVPPAERVMRSSTTQGGLAAWPKKGDFQGVVGAIVGTNLEGLMRTDRLPIFNPGQGAPAKFLRVWLGPGA